MTVSDFTHTHSTETLSACSTRASSSSYTTRLFPTHDPHFPEKPSPLPYFISAKTWAIADGHTGYVLTGKDDEQVREVASLTKVLTCYTFLTLDVARMDTLVTVSKKAAETTGTSAGLCTGDKITVKDLLYAVLLPSGNDAAVALAEFAGQILSQRLQVSRSPENLFVCEMNRMASTLGMNRSHFNTPHGMVGSLSTAADISLLAAAAMRIGIFRKVVRCTQHVCYVRNTKGMKRVMHWENTNQLLPLGYDGLKTGITPLAGPCLSASLHQAGVHLIVTVLSCKSKEARWSEVQLLSTWALSNAVFQSRDIRSKRVMGAI